MNEFRQKEMERFDDFLFESAKNDLHREGNELKAVESLQVWLKNHDTRLLASIEEWAMQNNHFVDKKKQVGEWVVSLQDLIQFLKHE